MGKIVLLLFLVLKYIIYLFSLVSEEICRLQSAKHKCSCEHRPPPPPKPNKGLKKIIAGGYISSPARHRPAAGVSGSTGTTLQGHSDHYLPNRTPIPFNP